jgi:hypothetical protein
MQTCPSLRSLPSLRAVSPGHSPRRQRPHPMKLRTLEREALSALSNSPRPTCAIGWRAGLTCRQCDRGTLRVPGLLVALSARRRRNSGPRGPVPRRVCRAALVRQPAPSVPHSDRPHVAGQSERRDGAGSCLPSGWTPASLLPVARPAPRCGARRAGRQTGPHTPHPCDWRRGLRSMLAGPGGLVSAACPGLLEG